MAKYAALGLPLSAGQLASSTTEDILQNVDGNDAFIKVPGGALKNRMFRIRLAGRTEAGSGNVTIALYHGTSGTVGSNSVMATSGAITNADGSFWLEYTGFVEDDNDILTGAFSGVVCGTLVGLTDGTDISSFDPDDEHWFSVTADQSASDSANLVQLLLFELEVL